MRRPGNGRRTDPRSLFKVGRTAAQIAEDAVMNLPAGGPSYQFRADTVTLSAGNVATIPNRRGADALVLSAGTLAAPASDALFGGAQSIAFTGTQIVQSNLAASAWQFLQDGTGGEVISVVTFASAVSASLACLWTTRNATNGAGPFRFSNGQHSYALSSAGVNNVVAVAGGAIAVDTPISLGQSFAASSPIQYQLWTGSVAGQGAAVTTTPATPDYPFRIGGGASGQVNFQGKWCETLIFPRVLHEYERQIVREYIAARYAIAAPSMTGVDRDIMSLLPFSWPRFDSYTTLGGNVTAILDKARPGHSFSQGTAGSQVLNPVASANFNGQLTATFAASKTYLSSLSAAAWTNIGPLEGSFFTPLRSTSFAAIQIMFESWNSGGGMTSNLAGTTGNWNCSVYRPSSGVGAAALTGNAINVSRLYQGHFAPLLADNKATGMSSSQGAIAVGTVSATTKSMSYSGRAGSFPVIGETPELGIIFGRALTAPERARVEAYYLSRYGLAA